MLAISPDKETSTRGSNFQSASGVVHINSSEDWRQFKNDAEDTMDRSIEEILGAGRSLRSSGSAGTRTGPTTFRSGENMS